MKRIAQPCLPPQVYFDPAILEIEKSLLLRRNWQWAGLLEDTEKPGGLTATIAEVPVAIEKTGQGLRVSLAIGAQRDPLPGAVADACGRFVFVRLEPGLHQSLESFLGDYASVLHHASDCFDEVFDADVEIWDSNWKAGLEITLEGYHVPYVHGGAYLDQKDKKMKKASNFANAVPKSRPPSYNGPHSTHTGVMSPEMRNEMANIAKRLKIRQSDIYNNYDHFTLFPNMTIGFSGGCLCFMQIYSPRGPHQTELRYAYILARPIDPAQKPVALIKKTLLDTWRGYTDLVLGEDHVACDIFQRGVRHARHIGVTGIKAEERLIHFQEYWRKAMEDSLTLTNSEAA